MPSKAIWQATMKGSQTLALSPNSFILLQEMTQQNPILP